jgi:type II secretory pathway component PulK
LRSIRSCSRARTTSQRGFALVWAIGLSLLFFMLIELMLIDSARELKEARRFRARMVAQILAENAAELAAKRIVDDDRVSATEVAEDWQGKMGGSLTRNAHSGLFRIIGDGEVKGPEAAKARVTVEGMAKGTNVKIDWTIHEP